MHVLGKYRVLRPLASGGMADVLLAEMRGLAGFHKLVVLKRIRSTIASDERMRAMFEREISLASRLVHPHVVQTYEVCEDRGEYLLAMEHVDGQTLSRIARAGGLDPLLYVRIIADALAGLGYAHRLADFDGTPLGIVHRDISPQNIMVSYEGDTKLLDFGIAKARNSALLTQHGIVRGKLAYMAPEQARGEELDRRADLFGMGVLLWELLAGKRLFYAGSNAETIRRLLVAPIPRLLHVDPELDAIVMKALERERHLRWSSAEEMRDALERYLRTRARITRDTVARAVSSLFAADRAEERQAVRKSLSPMAVTVPPPPTAKGPARTWPAGTMGILGGLAFCVLSFFAARERLPRPAHVLRSAVPQAVDQYKIRIAAAGALR
jgi:serine/threonine-protein kinase